MKIESHDIRYTMSHEFSYEKIDTFKKELNTLSQNKTVLEKKSKQLSEIDFIQRIKFMLIQELLQSIFLKKDETCASLSISEEKFFNTKKGFYEPQYMKALDTEYVSTYKEFESLFFKTQGLIETKDGREIELALNFNMKRSFYSKTTLQKTVFIDPLVVNLDGNLPAFDSKKSFSFDIDCDGESDQISCLSKNSGFLALDKNQNGSIDDGSELFGATNGNGFNELSQYDQDNNRWIDENDDVFDSLRIWSDDKLIALGEVGLGAIYLGAHSSPYTYKDDNNKSLGRLRRSSVVLFEAGKVGTISQIDFAKNESTNILREALSKA